MKVQLSQKRIVPDAITVWSEHGPEVDLVMDLKQLTFRPGTIDELYSFHVLDHLFPEELVPALKNWRTMLVDGGKLYTVVDDFEYLARGFVGGDLSIELINEFYTHPSQITRDYGVDCLGKAGFSGTDTNIWFVDVPGKFRKQHFELVLESTKHGE